MKIKPAKNCDSWLLHLPSTTASKITSAPWSTIFPLSGETNLGAVDFLVLGEYVGVLDVACTGSWWSATPFTTLRIVCWWTIGLSWFSWSTSSVFWLWTFKRTMHRTQYNIIPVFKQSVGWVTSSQFQTSQAVTQQDPINEGKVGSHHEKYVPYS